MRGLLTQGCTTRSHEQVTNKNDIPLRKEFFLEVIQKQGNTVPLHFAALVMEIKVVVLDLRIIQNVNVLLEGIAHRLLVTLLVDQVDNELRSVQLLLGLKVSVEGFLLQGFKLSNGM